MFKNRIAIFPILFVLFLAPVAGRAAEERTIPKMPGQQQELQLQDGEGAAEVEAPARSGEKKPLKGNQPEPSPLGFLAPMLIMMVVFYFLVLRPQQKQTTDRKKMLEGIKTGDEVQLSGGILGTVRKVKDDILTINIAEGVDVRVRREGVTTIKAAGTTG